MWTYRVLPFLPKLPDDMKQAALESAYSDNIINTWALPTHGRPLYKDGKEYGQSSAQIRRNFSEEFPDWVRANLIEEFNDCGVSSTEPGMEHVGPHTDYTRKFTLLYVLRSGGPNSRTVFYRSKKEGPLQTYYSNYDDVEVMEEIQLPLETWCLINAGGCIHSVENITEGRVTVQVSLMKQPWF